MKINTLDFDAQALRNRILDLAMRGKLVPQDPTDEPVNEQLARIQNEKDRLINRKIIKKGRSISPVSSLDKPFNIPNSWKWVRLGTCTFNYDHKRVPVSITDRKNRKKLYDYYGASGKIDKIDEYLFSEPLLLISEDGANLIRRTKPIAFIARGKYWVNNHAHIMGSVSLETLKFISYYVNMISLATYITGTAQPKLTQQNLNKIPIPLPPLEEQKRIATKITHLFDLITKIEEASKQYKDLQASLKSKVLDSAMHGKLVEQNPNDEPASELLKKINAEKATLIKEKKIKKSKPLPPITDDEKPLDIPDSWEWVRLGEIGTITSGGTPKKSESKLWENGNIPWITPATMSGLDNQIIFNNKKIKYINQLGVSHSSAQLIPSGSLIVSSRAPIGYVNIVPFDYTTNQGCKSITLFGNIENEFMYFATKNAVPQMYKRASGTTFKEISGSKFSQVVIPLPPLEEQKRIVTKIEKVFDLLN